VAAPPAKRPSIVAKPAPAPAPAKGGIPPDLQRVLDEVESYVSLGFVDDAKEALGEVGQKYAGHPALVQKLAELGLGEVAAKPAPPAKPAVAKAPPPPAKPKAPPKAAPAPAPPPPKPAPAPKAPPPKPAPAPPPLPSFDAESLVDEPAFEEPPSPPADELDLGEPTPPMDEDLPAPPPEELVATLGMESPSSPLGDAFGDLALEDPAPPPDLADSGPLGGEGGIDLGAELGDLFGAQAAVAEEPPPAEGTDLGDAGLADIFKEFKKGVDKQLGKEDYDTRYNLGIAYKEMGLIDEAIAEFQLAAKDEGRMLECASMLGICFLEKGMPKLAVKWFEKGLAAPGRGEEEYQGLRYDLASALEAAGETDRALSIFTELYGQDANFRDVASKVRELRAALR
jgi:pilus assembly protein FimV